MECRKLSSVLHVLCILMLVAHFQLVLTQPDICLPNCWSPAVPIETRPQHAGSETECKELCINNEDCTGAFWGPDAPRSGMECRLSVATSLTDARYWKKASCTDDCLSYCWKNKTSNAHQHGGSLQEEVQNETACKWRCGLNSNCLGVVWNLHRSQCWNLLHNIYETTPIQESVNKWDIVRNPQNQCTIGTSTQTSDHATITVHKSTTEGGSSHVDVSASTAVATQQDTIVIALATMLGACILVIIALSIYAAKLRKNWSKKKNAVVANVNDDESYKDYQNYQNLRRPDNINVYDNSCEYTAIELENIQQNEDEDDDNVYYNENQ